ncbi:MAG TPA: hypothetical protein VGO87_11400 [Acidimicrobiia bacterium]|jgi:hypothetical protein
MAISTPTEETAPDEPTTTDGGESSAALLEKLRRALVAEGKDPGLVDAQLYSLTKGAPSVVGNFADLQRVGATNAPKEDQPDFVMPAAAEPPNG